MGQSYHMSQPSRPSSGLAIGSLISSILGLTFLPTIGSIVGLVLGYMARRQIEESMGRMGGEGMAKAGIIIGWIGVGLAVLGICLVVVAFVFLGGLGLFATGFGR
ncbi:MAG: DUF4190 domain-containing protein [Anaerolineae bacterium]|jgi:uncharacterized membrane protein